MNILILGAGGREHALTWKIKQSPQCEALYVSPGNAGTAQIAENITLFDTYDEAAFEHIADFAIEQAIQLIVVGPEAPLVAGIQNFFRDNATLTSIRVIGPDRVGAQLEGSKDYAKAFMQRHQIPTARSRTFAADQLAEALAYLQTHSLPIVLKADGLAAGKGVIIAETLSEAEQALDNMLTHRQFGEASQKVVIEEFLSGIELSVFVLTDGRSYQVLPEAKDYKRIGEGDTGPNTGGMGAVSPVPFADAAFMQRVEAEVIQPTIHGLAQEGIDYCGFIFIGLMNVDGAPYVIEYNVRLGDPEAEVVVPRVEADWVELLTATAQQQLDTITLTVSPQAATTVVMVSEGYPGAYEKGKVISGLSAISEALVFHAGTSKHEGEVVTNGGRVVAVTALADTMEKALQKSYQSVAQIHWEGSYHRKDIGQDLDGNRSKGRPENGERRLETEDGRTE